MRKKKMTNFVVQVFWLLLPAGIANMTPVLIKRLAILDLPIYKKILGGHKTWRGLISGTLAGIITVYIQFLLLPWTKSIAVAQYSSINLFLLGLVLGGGAMVGDMIGSLLKRWVKIPPGKSFPVIDQIDWILAVVIFMRIFYDLPPEIGLTGIIIFGLLHPIINLIGYVLKIKENKF
jgi:CDP-2,3-bis-(O-geranylgeranyl)-sn-glycerol synthase